MLACRACRVPMTAQHGCALCEPIRPHLVTTDEGEDDDRPALSVVSGETVAALRAQMKVIRAALKLAPDDPLAFGKMIAVSNSVAKVIESARKLQADGLSAIENMSFLERAELFVAWYAELAPAYRQRLMAELVKFESAAQAPVKQLAAEVSHD